MGKIKTLEELKVWYSIDEIIEASDVLGVSINDPTVVWPLREQCRMLFKRYKRVCVPGNDPGRFLHVSCYDSRMVAYTASEEDGVNDIQRRTTLKKYCTKFGLENPDELQCRADSLGMAVRIERLEVLSEFGSFISQASLLECRLIINELIDRVSTLTGCASELEDASDALGREMR